MLILELWGYEVHYPLKRHLGIFSLSDYSAKYFLIKLGSLAPKIWMQTPNLQLRDKKWIDELTVFEVLNM